MVQTDTSDGPGRCPPADVLNGPGAMSLTLAKRLTRPSTAAKRDAMAPTPAEMVAAQLEVNLAQALIRLRVHAFGRGRPLAEVARDVVARRLRLADDPPLS